MDQQAYEAYAADAQQLAERDFGGYKLRVAAFAVLGYVVIVAILLLLIGVTGAVVATALFSSALFLLLLKKKVLFLLLPLIWVLLRALWVKIEAPNGYELKRERVPQLFAELDALTSELRSLPLHRVLLTPELNAAVVQTPRLGIFGWHRNTLILGLELLLTLTPEQARAVVAHELGHLSGNHSRFHGWIYRVRSSWYRILQGLQDNDSIGTRMLLGFFNWYAPRFSAYSFPLARFNEYEADAVSAELTSSRDAAAALVNVHVTAPFIDEAYWLQYFRKADEVEVPDKLPWQGLSDFLQGAEDEALETRLNEALASQTNFADTHPCLSERLGALGVNAEIPEPGVESAAQAWFGSSYSTVLNDFDRDWMTHNAEAWKGRFNYVQDSRQRMAELSTKADVDLNDEELWQLASLDAEFGDPEHALVTLGRYQDRKPDAPDCAYLRGVLLMKQDDSGCLDAFRQALAEPSYAYDASCQALDFARQQNNTKEIEYWEWQLEHAARHGEEAQLERQNLDTSSELAQVDLSDETLKALLAQLGASKRIGKLWVARKVTRHYPDIPAYAFACTLKGMVVSEGAVLRKVIDEVDGFEGWLVPKAGDYKALAKHIIKHGRQVK